MGETKLMYLDSVKLFYEESKAAREQIDKAVDQYRANTATALALATGATAFFGFSDSPKGPLFTAALVAYAIAVGVAMWTFWPTEWRVNVAHGTTEVLATKTLKPIKVYFDYGVGHQRAIKSNLNAISGLWGLAAKFRILLAATAAVVILAGANVTIEQSEAPADPMRIVIVEE